MTPTGSVLTILAATAQQPNADAEIIALIFVEIRRLVNAFVLATAPPPAHTLHRSLWRRTSQAPSPSIPLPAQTSGVTLEY
ncbi:hypothetical protein ABZX66_30820 [Micromonospora aurantiaca]|uniref:hypothetical protein n=1 Tax=Micromonospora aurantiaca (nom. illeg.) TaxID=47850 RepID=UPI0033A678F4